MENSTIKEKKHFFDSDTSIAKMGILLGLTLVLIVLGGLYTIPGIMDHPQFTTILDPAWVSEKIFENKLSIFSYFGFFFVDFFWSFLLLLVIWKYVKRHFYLPNPTGSTKFFFVLFSIITLLAWIADVTENSTYAFYYYYWKLIVDIKTGLYVAVVFSFLLAYIKYSLKNILFIFFSFLKAALISLLILAIIGVFLPKAPQVNSIVVALYASPLNFAILLLFAPIYAVTLAHYPSYFLLNKKYRSWYKAESRWKTLIGVISYRYKDGYKTTDEGKVEGKVNFLFRTLGIFFYAALFYLVAYTSEVNFDWPFKTAHLTVVLVTLGVLLLYKLKKTKDKWLQKNHRYFQQHMPCLYDGDYAPDTEIEKDQITTGSDSLAIANSLLSIKGDVMRFIYLFILTLVWNIGFVIWLLVCEECQYTNLSVACSLICIALQMASFVYYRSFRSVLRFFFFDCEDNAVLNAFYIMRNIEEEDVDKENDVEEKCDHSVKEKKQMVFDFYKNHSYLVSTSALSKLLIKFRVGALSNNITFLQYTAVVGVINAAILLYLNIRSQDSVAVNAILIILSSFFLYYGIIVVVTKNFIYYKYSHEKKARTNCKRFNYLLIVSLLVLFVFNRAGRISGNELFSLKSIDRTERDETFLTQYVAALPTNETRYYIGSYGGGMKANAWTLSVLKHLYNEDSSFFNKTIGISGASGGTMGLINMSAIVKANPKNDAKWDELIYEISTSNILSLDITHILGRDSFNHMFVPSIFGYKLSGFDRSTKAMEHYAKISGNDNEVDFDTKKSYRTYWKKLYEIDQNNFPILISNTTNVKGNQGMAVSVKIHSDSTYIDSLIYNGGDNILDITERSFLGNKIVDRSKTLSYYDAASTSNRFPLISPAAKIETKGHYNDGGIYENSGLLSAYKLFRAVNRLDKIKHLDALKQRNVFVNIVNSKDAYIRYRLRKLALKVSKINDNTEINAILSSIASTEMFPIYIKTELQRLANDHTNIDFKTIYLPHRFTVADVKRMYGTELDNGTGLAAFNELLYQEVQDNDAEIRKLVTGSAEHNGKPIVEPPMSRVMATQAFEFMQQMLAHPDVTANVKAIID